jgi:feruloyl esterase
MTIRRHLFVCLLALAAAAFAQTPCDRLRSMELPGAAVTLAESVGPGPFQLPGAPSGAAAPMLAAHCRVALTLKPSPDSDIKAEIWLPVDTGWNGKLLGVGGGGFVGAVNYGAMAGALGEGYAAASTDTGHAGGSAEFALGHPEKVVDFAWRAVHEMTLKAKAVVLAHYGRAARFSYWQGCSTGGRQGLMEAQRFPEDYDGIVAGAPANNQIQLCAWRMAIMVSVLQDAARALPPAKIAILHQAVLDACDALDGVKDGLLTDPRQCRFDPATLLCRGADQNNCLTAPQIETVKMAYRDARTKNGDLIYPGLLPGSEIGWLLPGQSKEPGSIDLGMFRYLAHQDANWGWRAFDLDRDTALAEQRAGFMEAVNPDLSAFKARGGKLLIYHGWSDGGSGGAISPVNTIQYYSSVLARMGPDQQSWLRLFMVPGMLHCGGGPGPNQFNAMAVLERWRELGQATDMIFAAHVAGNRVEMTRPLCAYPELAVYKGSGSTNDAGNFACKMP